MRTIHSGIIPRTPNGDLCFSERRQQQPGVQSMLIHHKLYIEHDMIH